MTDYVCVRAIHVNAFTCQYWTFWVISYEKAQIIIVFRPIIHTNKNIEILMSRPQCVLSSSLDPVLHG